MKNQKIHDIIYHKEDPRKREMPCDNAGAARSAQECARSIIYHKEDLRSGRCLVITRKREECYGLFIS